MSEPGATVLVTATSNGSMMSRSSKSSSRCYLYSTHTWCLKHTQFKIVYFLKWFDSQLRHEVDYSGPNPLVVYKAPVPRFLC